jgi:hypothetical protein
MMAIGLGPHTRVLVGCHLAMMVGSSSPAIGRAIAAALNMITIGIETATETMTAIRIGITTEVTATSEVMTRTKAQSIGGEP